MLHCSNDCEGFLQQPANLPMIVPIQVDI